MTDDQKYNELLKALGQVLKDKDDIISLQNYKINDLLAKLKEFENNPAS